MMHISASTAPIRVKQKPLYSKLNAESDKYYYNSLCKSLENPPESLSMELKYSEAPCELAASTKHAGKLIRFGER